MTTPTTPEAALLAAMPTTEIEWTPFWHRVDDPDGWVVSIYGDKLATAVLAIVEKTTL